MADDTYDEYEDESGDGGPMVSPLQMLMMPGYTTVTPEGKAKAAEVFTDLYGKRTQYDEEEQASYDEYENQARQAREILKRAREVLAAKKTPSTRWLEMARGFGMPTRAGSFGESIANYAGERIPGRQRETEWEQNRDQQLMGYDQGMNTIDQQLALQRLKLRQAHRAADDKLMLESMKIMGKPIPQARNPPRTPQDRATEKLDAAYVKDYVDFIQQGAANASADIQALAAANRVLKGTKLDPKTGQEVPGKKSDTISGPVIGLFPKVVRDIITPKGSETQENVESVAQKSLRVILGPQFTAKEGENMLARVYNPRFEEPVNARRVQRLLEQLQRAYAEKTRAAQYFQQNGTLAGFKGRTKWNMSWFDPDVPEGRSPLDSIKDEAAALMGGPAPASQPAAPGPASPAPDQGMDEIPIESLLPAKAHGGAIKKGYAEGGQVQGDFPDGLPRFRMPDGKVIRGRPGDTYEFALDVYTKATGTAPTIPGLPPQQIPPREDVPPEGEEPSPEPAPAPQPGPVAATPSGDSYMDYLARVGQNIPGAVGMTAGAAAGAGLADKMGTAMLDRAIPGRQETPAQRRVLDMMSEMRRSPADVTAGVRKAQGMGIPAMAMDDPALRMTAESVMTESGMPNATEALNRLKARQEGIGERVMDRVNVGLKPDEYFDQLDKLRENLYENSKPLYQQAYAQNPSIKSKVLPALLNTPDGKKAVKKALRIMRNSGRKIGKADAMGMVSSPSLEFLDNVKRGLDDLIAKEEGHGANYQATELGKSMRDLRNSLRDELDAVTTPKKGESLYKKAREQYAGDLEILDALQTGRDEFSKMQPQEVSRRVKDMSFAEKDAYRTGVAQSLFEQLESPTGDFNAARKIIGSPAMRKKLRVLFDTDKQYELFETALQKESDLYELSKKSIARGEQGQEMHAEPRQTLVKRVAKHVPRLGWKSPTMWALQFIRNNSEATEAKIDEVMKHMKASTPEELADFEKTLGPKFSRRIARKGRASKVAAAGAVAGGIGAVLASEDDEEDDDAE